jgi:glycosyltransferase involved in cell wall biosynthesis
VRIAVISSSVFAVPLGGYGGLEQIAYYCARGLAAKGHDVTLFAPEGSHCEGAKVFETGKPGQWDEKWVFKGYWPELMGQDCIISHDWQKWVYTLKTEGVLKAPVLGVMHAPVNTMYATLPPNVDRPCFVCISQDQANHFQALHSRAARVCYNGIDLDFYQPMGVPRSDRFLFLARFSSIKGADLAVEACIRAEVGLDLVGDVSITHEPGYLEQVKARCDGKQIRFIGPQARGETVWWFSQAKALLHPNQRFREPLGLAPLEAMACSCPVIAWRYGAMSETVDHGRSGMLVDSLDQMVEAIKAFPWGYDEAILRANCREWASQFSIERMVNRYHDLCIEAVEGGGW